MAGQFDNYVKILGTGSRPDRFKGAPGNPDIVAPVETNAPSTTPDNTNRSLPANAPKQGAADKAGKQAADVAFNQKYYGKGSRKRQIEGLKTTTMRLNEKTGEAYDSSEVVPPKAQPVSNLLSKGYVKPNTSAKPADWDGTGTPLSAENAERIMANYKPEPISNKFDATVKETVSLPKADETPAPTNQPYNPTTGEVKAEFNDPNSINSTTLSWDPKINDARETGVRHVSPQFAKVDKIKARRGGTVHSDKVVRDFETEHPDSDASSAATGKTLSSTNRVSRYTEPSKVTMEPMTEPVTAVVDEGMPEPKLGEKGEYTGVTTKGAFDPYNEDGTLSSVAHEGILSTTMREVPAEGPERILGHVPVRSPRDAAPYEKPTVNKPGNVIPPMAIDTFGAQPTDRKQAEAENKRLRENRRPPVNTAVFDPNARPARPARGQTPERAVVLGAIREKRSAALASEGKTMTTVHPAVMDTAMRLGRTSMYNLDDNYMSTPGFLGHEAVQKATVAHALGVHHTLGTDDDHLHKYLGGKPLEAKARLAAAYKIVDRNLRGNPEKVAGEFALLRGMVHAGSSPQQTLRAVRSGESNDVVVNGQNVTLAKTSSENRQKIADTTTDITAQAESAPKAAKLGSIAATPTAPLAGTGRVAVRRIGQPPEKAVIREFSPQEARNRKNVPGPDDSKRPPVIDLQGLKPGEKDTNKTLKEEKDS
jgi:hypothetical protein